MENDDEQTQVENITLVIDVDGELDEVKTASYARHCTTSTQASKKGKNIGKEVVHFNCNYCKAVFQGPGSSTFLVHLRQKHPSSCPNCWLNQNQNPAVLFLTK